jgi:class 3 adenylate cyclase/tetratricopeptide (TPR) repeat protein
MTTTCPGPSCGFACETAFAFCPGCGARQPIRGAVTPGDRPVAAAPPPPPAEQEADRRQVTVLFADLTGFTSLAERLDPETVRAFQNALFATMAEVIARYDGFVEKFVGDAVMAVFGAPHAHEDDPLRALLAARELLRRVEALGREWNPRLGRAVTLHIGVHTGPVVAGSLGSGAGAGYAVTGDTVNCASRLLTAAAPGAVLVSAATQAIVRDRCVFEAATSLEVRGRAEPLRVHRLIDVAEAAGPARGLEALGLRAPLVGRDDALETLRAACERARAGQAQVVRVIGEAGVGKTRLIAEWLSRLDAAGTLREMALRRIACTSLGEPTYGTFAALFRDAYRVDESDSLEVAQRKLHAGLAALGADARESATVAQVLSWLLGLGAAGPQEIEPEQLQRQITLAARALIERRLAQQALLIVVDDLQWADAASVALLGRIVDQLADRPLMLLLTQRADAPAWPGTRVAAAVIRLEALADAATGTLVDALLGATPASDTTLLALRDHVVARAGGNPLFVEEVVRNLVDAGALHREQGHWVCGPSASVAAVPPTLYGLLLSRVDRLDAGERRALQEAAILGAEFDAPLLQRVAADPAATAAALPRLAAHGLIHAADADATRWRFTHALLHEVVYQNLLLTRRTEWHGRAGAALEASALAAAGEAHAPRRLAELEALGHHWSLSSDPLRGARYLLAAADWARAVYANQDALRHCERALRTLVDAGPALVPDAARAATELDARERVADLLALQGRRAEALAQFECVILAAHASGEGTRHARVLRKTGGLHWDAGDRERASACFRDGLAVLGAHGDPIERAHLFQEMGRLAFRGGEHDTAVEWAQRALAELPAADATRSREAGEVHAAARNTLGVALARLGRTAEAVMHIETAVAEAEAQEMLHAACRGYTNLGVLYATLDPQRGIDTCLRGLEAAQRVGDLGFESRLYANLAVAYCALTNRCDAEGIDAAQAAINLDRRLGLVEHLAVPLVVLGQIHQCHGDAGRAFAAYQEALALAEQIDEPQLLFPCYDGLATLYLDAGRAAEAEALLAKAQAVCERAGVEPDALMVLPFLC